MHRQVLSQDNAVCLHVQHGVFVAQVPKRSRTRACSRRYKKGPIQGQESVRDFRAISFAIMRCMGIPCNKIHIAFLTLRQPLALARMYSHCLPHCDSLAPEPCAQAGQFISNIGFITQAGYVAHLIHLYVPLLNSRTESSDHLAVDT